MASKVGGLLEWLLKRAAEPSTWRGVGAMLVAVGIASPETVESVTVAGVALVGVVEVFRQEF